METSGGRRYSVEELRFYEKSPLVENQVQLKALIEGWMNNAADQNRNPRANTRTQDESANGNGQRPTLFQTRNFSRGSNAGPEDIILGPPKPSFSSNRKSEGGQKSPLAYRDNETPPIDKLSIRDKFFRERESERQRERSGTTNGRRTAKEDGEEGESWPRGVDRDKGRYNRESRENGAEEDGDSSKRRNGVGRGKGFDWLMKDDGSRAGPRQTGWRDREQQRERKDDRDWTRGGRNGDRAGDRVDSEPEWMRGDAATPPAATKTETKPPRTQEDFQRWKEQMKAGGSSAEPKEEERPPSQVTEVKTAIKPSKPATPLALEGGLDRLFGGAWTEMKKAEPTGPDASQATNQKAKMKASKFAGFFAPREEPTPQPTAQPPPAPEPTMSPPVGSTEDRAGFNRILDMLHAQKPSPSPTQTGGMMPPPPKPRAEQQSKPMFEDQNRAGDAEFNAPRRRETVTRTPAEEQRNPFDAPMMPQNPNDRRTMQALLASLPVSPAEQMRNRSPPQRLPEANIFPPNDIDRELNSRSAAQRTPRGLDQNSEFLLNLMQQRGTPSQQAQAHRPPPPQQANYNIFLDEEPKAPKPQKMQSKGLPPGLFNDYNIYEPEPPRPEISRKTAQRAPPPGLYDDPAIASLQRRATGENLARHHMTNMGIPQHPGPDQFLVKAAGAMQHQERIAPPPGFNGPTPGRHGPPGFAPPGMPLNNQIPHPAMQRGMGGGPPGMFQGGMQGGLQGPPPGFYREQMGAPGFPPGPVLGHESMLGLEQMNPHPNQLPRHFDPYGGMPQGRPGARGGPGPGYGM